MRINPIPNAWALVITNIRMRSEPLPIIARNSPSMKAADPAHTILFPALMNSCFPFHTMGEGRPWCVLYLASPIGCRVVERSSGIATDNDKIGSSTSLVR